MIAFYNQNVGDVLMVTVADNNQGAKLDYERKGDVVRIFQADSDGTVAWNFFGGWAKLENGQIALSVELIAELNERIGRLELVADETPRFVVAEILSMTDHPDSDHLHICQVSVGAADPVQIVCGAANAAVGLKTVAVLPIALMPNGALIFDGSLRGVASHGMLCSARELALPNAPEKRGIIELAADAVVGSAFSA